MTGQDIGEQFIEALRAADFAAIGDCLAPAVRLQALLPSRTVDTEGREQAVALLRGWLAADTGCTAGTGYTVLEAGADIVGRRLHLSYLVQLDSDEGLLVMQQQAYCDIAAGRLSSVRLLCSGHMPVQAARQ